MHNIRVYKTVAVALCAGVVLTGCAGGQSGDTSAPSASPSASASASASGHWSYSGETGPSGWGELSPTCAPAESSTQSPIAIDTTHTVPRADDAVTLQYRPTTFTVENNGHTIEAVPDDPGANRITVDGSEFTLKQFHFHGPSEHELNGANAAMELHLVHTSGAGAIAVLGVLIEAGAPHDALAELFDTMPATEADEHVRLTSAIDPADLLPDEPGIVRYTGSLTTPPCTEGVLWNLYESSVSVSSEQLAAFAAIFADNHRPVQALNGREVTGATAG